MVSFRMVGSPGGRLANQHSMGRTLPKPIARPSRVGVLQSTPSNSRACANKAVDDEPMSLSGLVATSVPSPTTRRLAISMCIAPGSGGYNEMGGESHIQQADRSDGGFHMDHSEATGLHASSGHCLSTESMQFQLSNTDETRCNGFPFNSIHHWLNDLPHDPLIQAAGFSESNGTTSASRASGSGIHDALEIASHASMENLEDAFGTNTIPGFSQPNFAVTSIPSQTTYPGEYTHGTGFTGETMDLTPQVTFGFAPQTAVAPQTSALQPRTQNLGLAPVGDFTPTNMVLFGPGYQRPPTLGERILQHITRMSPNYMGDPGNPLNYSHTFLRNDENCSFWLTDLPKNVLENEIFSAIRPGTGRIFALHINRDDLSKPTAGAKLVFFDRAGATNFYNNYVLVPGSITIRGHSATIMRNRNKTPQSDLPQHRTRCLRIRGPRHLVNENALLTFFRGNLVFNIDCIIHHRSRNPRIAIMTIRFAAYQGQASMAIIALRCSEEHNSQRTFHVRWEDDPCA